MLLTKNAKAAATIFAFTLMLVATVPSHAQQKAEDLAQKASGEWLALTDSGKYAESWDEASTVFKTAVTKDQWQGALHKVRDPLGKLISRKFKSATYTKSLPGAPDGEYVVIQYETNFENKQSAVETVTPALDKDGKWRVSGYFIR